MTATVKQNADNARQASQLAGGSRSAAEKGGHVVASAVAGIAALLLSIRPEASPAQVRDWIVRGAMSRIVRAGGALRLAMAEG